MASTLDTLKSRAVPRLRSLTAISSLFLASCTLITSIDQRPIDAPQPVIDQHPPTGELLQFDIADAELDNHFFRQGSVAAHLLTSKGTSPRLIVAFPAGNTGVGVWFEDVSTAANLVTAPNTKVEGIERADGMRGVTAHLQSNAESLTVKKTVLGNIRTLRQYIYDGDPGVPAEVTSQVVTGIPLLLHRATVDGKHRVELRLGGEDGTTVLENDGKIEIKAGSGGQIRLAVTAVADDTPLTQFTMDQLLNDQAADRPTDKQALAFLVSKEKFLAGSWRFLTYFGRDTLLSLRMLMPVLKPDVIEGALGSVLERLQADGDVAHEEGIGEFAALENKKAAMPPKDLLTPVLDYKMIDDDFLLLPVLGAYLGTEGGKARAKDFFAKKTPTGELYSDQVKKNLDLVMKRAEPFFTKPSADKLVSIKDGISVGNWRDSDNGLGGGRKPFDVNVALVPAALSAAKELYTGDLLGAPNADSAAKADQYLTVWKTADTYFRVSVPVATAQMAVSTYAASVKLDPAAAVASLDADVVYHGVSVDDAGKAVPVMHTDSGFVMVFTDPSAEYLDAVAKQITRPFPAGLLLPGVGVVVANAVYADAAVQGKFTSGAYHGAVVWSWQQALLASGLKRQLARADLPETTKAALKAAETALWSAILAQADKSTGELWSWKPGTDGKATLQSFAEASGNSDESNAAQLWSTVYLAVKPPAQ